MDNDYIVLVAYTPEELADKVSHEVLYGGYVPQGGVSIAIVDGKCIFAQAMIYKAE